MIDNLKYRFSYMADMAFWGSETATVQTYYNSANNNSQYTSAAVNNCRNTTWQVENTLTYDKTFGDHHFNVVLGQSALSYSGYQIDGSKKYLVNSNKPSIAYSNGNYRLTYADDGTVNGAVVDHSVNAYPYDPYKMTSLFARLSYNYQERYMAQSPFVATVPAASVLTISSVRSRRYRWAGTLPTNHISRCLNG